MGKVTWRYIPGTGYGSWRPRPCSGRFCQILSLACRKKRAMRPQFQVCRNLGQIHPETDNPATNLTTEAEWEIWKTNLDMTENQESKNKQLALFLYCSLNF